ncbi:N-acetyltransferase [Candidatus Hydrogenisulfobacillus filiaventi]|uniref:N-acetyltransferase n=1 Tax=Candidatus Hydrogenisulfobacillus filiaventi TaxID=2707344 RepID=A0A6F8ZEB4_9FIRM|nr:GNAT family N-acetyltransferase [Bacillota bacterium]CAB1128107.1 N-acetyltransferase [Candidatus Hydrogenisulfobacillus filiaventi]
MLRFVHAEKADESRARQFLSQFTNDYLPQELSGYLERPRGGLYLALDDDRVVGTIVLEFPRTHEAYVGGLRVSPDRQKQGIGRQFVEFAMEEARRLGATIMRAVVAEGNQVSEHLMRDDLAFHAVERWRVGTIRPLPVPARLPDEAGPAWAVDHDRLLAFWNKYQDDLWADLNPWVPHSLSAEDISRRFETGGIALLPQTGAEVRGLALYRLHNRERLDIGYLRAETTEELAQLVQYLWVEAHAWGITVARFGLSRQAADRLLALGGLEETDDWQGMVFERSLVATVPMGSGSGGSAV